MTNKITKLYHNWEEYYIDEYQEWWKPGANTIAYYPLISDALDHSSNNNNLTGTVSYVTSENKQVAKFSWSSHLTASSWVVSTQTFTISFWVKLNSSSSEYCLVANANTVSSNDMWINITKFPNSYNIYGLYGKWTSSWWMFTNPVNPWGWTWVHYVSVFEGSNSIKTYANWNLLDQTSINSNIAYPSVNFSLWGSESRWRSFDWWLSEVIIEDKARTEQEIADYYNQTKSLYWIN